MRRVLVHEELCIGCGLCRVYCEAHHAGGDDLVKTLKKRTAPPAGGIRVEQNLDMCISVRCQHCADAPCLEACLTGALYRDEESGLVLVDQEKCIGCGTCMLVCPFGAIRKDEQTGKIVKCDGCLDRETPRCVSVCPNGALVIVEEKSTVPSTATGGRYPILV
ncbi:MAG: 4Fe-4S dicluster domain-containing protein [Dehalococcoidia bacterium]|nr:4Fe-4S dicluster domain-containing protein [Dehalococcoidia bacterium]